MIRPAIVAFISLLFFTASAHAGHHHKHHHRTIVIKFQLYHMHYTPVPKVKPLAWYARPPTGDDIYRELYDKNAGWNGEFNHYEP